MDTLRDVAEISESRSIASFSRTAKHAAQRQDAPIPGYASIIFLNKFYDTTAIV